MRLLLAVALALVAPRLAHAKLDRIQLVAPAPAPAADVPVRWYGWQVLLIDGALIGLSAATELPLALGAAVSGPIVHGTYGNWGRAALSFTLRVGAPVAGFAIGHGQCTPPSAGEFQILCDEEVGGFVVGFIIAEVVDVLALGWEKKGPPPPVVPIVQAGTNGFWVGLDGAF